MTGQHHGHTVLEATLARTILRRSRLFRQTIPSRKCCNNLLSYRSVRQMGPRDVGVFEEGLPRKQGFHEFFGFLNQTHAHNHYPDYLWRNEDKVPLSNEVTTVGNNGGGYATKAVVYADDLIAEDALRFVKDHQSEPFFFIGAWSFLTPTTNVREFSKTELRCPITESTKTNLGQIKPKGMLP